MVQRSLESWQCIYGNLGRLRYVARRVFSFGGQ